MPADGVAADSLGVSNPNSRPPPGATALAIADEDVVTVVQR